MAIGFKVRGKKEMTLIEVKGRVIGADGTKFADKLESHYLKNKKKLVVDLSETNFLDSYGLGTIVYYSHAMREKKRDFIILNTNSDPNTYVNRLFELTNLCKVLKIVDSKDAL
jgi:anti-anti-sigma factor